MPLIFEYIGHCHRLPLQDDLSGAFPERRKRSGMQHEPLLLFIECEKIIKLCRKYDNCHIKVITLCIFTKML